MNNQGNHMVTKCNWDTVFDSKSLAGEFQMKISHWSTHHLQRVVNTVFDELCPEGQTIKIKKLEIDLGVLMYEDLLSQLPIIVKETLKKQLRDNILYPKTGDLAVQIISENSSQVHLIRDFLLQGMLPWSYHSKYGSIDEIITNQLYTSKQEVINMIINIGDDSNVRKRIAWQFKETIIKKIIEGIAPNNYKKIIDFHEELIKVQEKETIVQTSTNDLKKNVWLWILDYLFTDRGTIFNTITFVRATMQQMANHFNLTYEVLLELIEEALLRVKAYTHVQKGFISIVQLLTKELREITYQEAVTEKQKEHFWEELIYLFKTPSERSNSLQKDQFNELILQLSKVEPERFKKVFFSIDSKETTWKHIVPDLKMVSRITILSTIAPRYHQKLQLQISFLEAFSKASNLKFSKDKVWEIAITFLRNIKMTSYSDDAFLHYSLDKIRKMNSVSSLEILEELKSTNIPIQSRDVRFITTFKKVNELYNKTISEQSRRYTESNICKEIDRYYDAKNIGSLRNNEQIAFEKMILKWINIVPKILQSVVVKHSKKTQLGILISECLEINQAERVLITIDKLNADLTNTFKKIILVLLAEEPKYKQVFQLIESSLPIIALQISLTTGLTTKATYINKLIQLLKQEKAIGNHVHFSHAIKMIMLHTNFQQLNISKEIQNNTIKLSKLTSLEELNIVLNTSKNQYDNLVKVIAKLIYANEIDTPYFKKLTPKIIAYIFPNNIQLYKKLIEFYSQQISSLKIQLTNSKAQKIITVCFWNAFIAYENHRGNVNKFKAMYTKAIIYAVPELSQKKRKQAKAEVKPSISFISSEYEFTLDQLFSTIENAIKSSVVISEISGVSYQVEKLFLLGLETSPNRMRIIIEHSINSKTQIDYLNKIIAFEQFTAAISDTQEKSVQAIQVLYFLVQKLGDNKIKNAIKYEFWNAILTIIKPNAELSKILTNLAQQVIRELAKARAVNSMAIVHEIQQSDLVIPKLLKKILRKEHTVFNLIVSNESLEVNYSDDLNRCIEENKLEALSSSLIFQGVIPFWFQQEKKYSVQKLLNEILEVQPLILLKVLRRQQLSIVQLKKLIKVFDFSRFIKTISKLYPLQTKHFRLINELYTIAPFVKNQNGFLINIQNTIFHKMISAWITSNWDGIKSTRIWNELIWETCTKKNIEKKVFLNTFKPIKPLLPTALQITFNKLVTVEKSTKLITKIQSLTKEKKSMENQSDQLQVQGITVPNAGLVILGDYFQMLLDRLELTERGGFKNEENQINAVHYLQYLVTGQKQTEEHFLMLNKVLCGIPLNRPIKDSLEITVEEENLMNGLIQACIGHWTAIGSTTINGFRGNWLVREGVLVETEDRWELTVEKRAYDLLLNQSPFSFSIIKMPWMAKPLHVNWAY